jgi:hypothetical protein
MLLDATIAVARDAAVFSAVARRAESLDCLANALWDSSGVARHYLKPDWDQPTEFLSALSVHVDRTGPPTFVLAWLHDMTLAPPLARALVRKAECEFFQVFSRRLH